MSEGMNLFKKLFKGNLVFSVTSALVKYQISEKLSSGPKSISELCESTPMNPERLFRYLRLVSSSGLFSYDSSTDKWSNTEDSSNLADPVARILFQLQGDQFLIEFFTHAEAQISSYKMPNETINRPVFFEQISQLPEVFSKFQDLMTITSQIVVPAVVNQIDLTGCRRVLDVGGADGTLVLNLAKNKDDLKFAILDRQECSQLALKNISSNGLSDRIEFITGNFFEEVASGFDCIILKKIIHDWPEPQCELILNNCRKSLKEGNKLFVSEMVLDPLNPEYEFQLISDHAMLMLHGGKERTLEEFKSLLSRTGFEYVNSKTCPLGELLIEARAI